MSPADLILGSMAVCAAGAVLALVLSFQRRASSFVGASGALASSALALAAAIQVARGEPSHPTTVWSLPGWGSALRLHVDGLSATFVALVAVIGLLAALYSIGYARKEAGSRTGWYWFNFLLFVAGMYGVVTVTDLMLFFCLFWQVMTLPSYALVRFDGRRRENVRAANRYLLLMEVSCALILGAAAILAPDTVAGEAGRFDFEALAAAFPATAAGRGGAATVGLLLFFCGFGVKAGMWPFGQLWLPDAHPAAPSPVSALLSGVMIKTGVYGLLRTFLWLLPAEGYDPGRWGLLLCTFGTATLFVGTVQALRQEQTKRLLAYSSIGQVGYIILAIGVALSLLGTKGDAPLLAAVAFHGAIFHVLNHGLFKSLLFLNAGSVLVATGTQDLNRLGGLLRLMPFTGWTAFVACLSIAGVPLTNGFASKWSIFVPTILGTREATHLGICGAVGIVTSALTLALVIKLYGSAFLSRRSDLVARRVGDRKGLEVSPTMVVPQLVLAALCVALGLLPFFGREAARLAITGGAEEIPVLAGRLADAEVALPGGLAEAALPDGRALLGPLVVAAVFGLLFLSAWGISRLGGGGRRQAPPWLCGYVMDADAYRYRSRGLYGGVRRYFRWFGGRPGPSSELEQHGPCGQDIPGGQQGQDGPHGRSAETQQAECDRGDGARGS